MSPGCRRCCDVCVGCDVCVVEVVVLDVVMLGLRGAVGLIAPYGVDDPVPARPTCLALQEEPGQSVGRGDAAAALVRCGAGDLGGDPGDGGSLDRAAQGAGRQGHRRRVPEPLDLAGAGVGHEVERRAVDPVADGRRDGSTVAPIRGQHHRPLTADGSPGLGSASDRHEDQPSICFVYLMTWPYYRRCGRSDKRAAGAVAGGAGDDGAPRPADRDDRRRDGDGAADATGPDRHGRDDAPRFGPTAGGAGLAERSPRPHTGRGHRAGRSTGEGRAPHPRTRPNRPPPGEPDPDRRHADRGERPPPSPAGRGRRGGRGVQRRRAGRHPPLPDRGERDLRRLRDGT